MQSIQTMLRDPCPPSKHASPLPAPPPSSSRHAHVTTATPAKRITFYKSGDSQFGGVRMAIHKRSFKCFDALLDDLSQKVPLPFGVRTVTTPRGTHTIKHLEQLQDGGCYLCSDRRLAKPINMELAGRRQGIWYHQSRRPQRPETSSGTPPGHLPHRQRRILLVKNTEPGMRRSIVLSRSSTRSLRAFLDEVSEVMQFHVRKLYTAEGRRIDSVQSLMTCRGVLVCVGREAFSPMLINFIRKTSEEKLPGLGSKSPGPGPRIPGNGARSPATQDIRSPPHGAQSRASEYDEGNETKKNVNFGLETKKSIIHPRSGSSSRSARFSLSSEKSYGGFSQTRPAITNDDIEKRVLVNKDGSLSVEMRVRFRLQNEETIHWSTQIKKSPSLTNDCCPLSQAQPHYLQQGASESCSDPDSSSYEGVDYSSQALQCALEGNQCTCCYQKHERQFDLWENPTHKHPPAPPAHKSSHTMVRHTHSSSSSSSCNSRRVIRCRAQLSRSPHGSGSEQSQLFQKEMCLTEQVEERVEVAQDGDTQVEVCKVSRCCSRTEVVSIDTNLRPHSEKSVEGEVTMGEDENRPLSAVSSSSHILQSLKEDQDDEEDDLPPSASQCSHRNEQSPTPTPATHLGEEPTSNISACSTQSFERKEKNENRGSRAVSSATSHHCGATDPHSTGKAEEMGRVPSSMSQEAKNQKSEEEGTAAIDNEEINRCLSGLSHNTGLSGSYQKSWASNICPNCGGCKRANSAMSAQTDLSAKSNKSKYTAEALLIKSALEKEGHNTAARTASSLSNKSGASVKSHKSICLSVTKEVSLSNKTVVEEDDTDKRAHSSLSVKSNVTDKSGKAKSVLSNKSDKSKVSAKSDLSCKQCAKALTPDNKEEDELNGIRKKREGSGVEDRTASAMSAKSNLSSKSNKSHRFTKASEKSVSPRSETGEDAEESATSQMSCRLPFKPTKSCKCNDNGKALSPDLKVEDNAEELPRQEIIMADDPEYDRRSSGARSHKSASSAKSHNATEEFDRSPSVTSERSQTSAKSTKLKRSNHPEECQNDPDLTLTETNGENEFEHCEDLESAKSIKSKSSVKSGAISMTPLTTNAVIIKTPEGDDEDRNEVKGEPCSDILCIETSQACEEVDNYVVRGTFSIDPHGQTLSPKRKPSSRSHSASSRDSQSPVQKVLPSSGAGEQRGPSSLSVHSKTSSKVSRSSCCCRTASALEMENKEEDRKSEEALSCSIKRQRKESGYMDQPLSRNSSGSISLGLPEDQETAESDCGKSSVSFCNTKRKSPFLPNSPVADIPTIETPRGGEDDNKESGEQPTERAASATTVKSSGSHTSCCNCSVKSAAQSKEKSTSSYPTKVDDTESVKSAATTNASKMDTPNSRSSSAMSGPKVRAKSPSGFSSNTDAENHNTSRPQSKTKEKEYIISVHSQSPCDLRPESTASVQSDTQKASDERIVAMDSVKSGVHKSHTGSEYGRTNVSSSGQKETSVKSSSPCSLHGPRPASKVEPGSESTLSHSLSAADLLKETLAAARQQSCQSKASKTSNKPHSEKSGGSQRNRNRKNRENVVELTPECLPNASASELVSDWLRSIPANSSMLTVGNELNEGETEPEAKEMAETPTEETGTKMSPEAKKVELGEKIEPQEEEKEEEAKGDGAGPRLGDTTESSSRSRNWHSSAAVMKVLLSSSLGRCWSMPEVSPVYGRRLSTSARGLLDCLAQLQLIEPAISSHEQKDRKQQYDEIMAILQSLWLTEPRDIEVKETKESGTEQVTPPRSSSGVGMSSGSGGSGKSNGNQDEPPVKETESLHEEETVGKVVDEEHGNAAARDTEVETDVMETNKTEPAEEPMKSEEQSTLPLDSSKATDNPSSSEKSSGNNSSKSPTDNERDTQEDSSSGTPPTATRPLLSKRLSQDPDPLWVLHLLKKLEKQFISHYIEAMAEFKVRWDLDDSLILDKMISELREEVSRRIQNSIEREMRKIQSRAGKAGRSPRPPQLANMSRDSTMTDRRRRMLKVMKNQSIKTGDSLTDEEMTGDFSDQRSDDEYCPCEACVRKKMAARPFKKNLLAAEAPVMMEFDLLKILQLKKCPLPPPTVPQSAEERTAADEEERNLEVVEEEEEEETKEDIKADVVLEETIPEEDEEEDQEKERGKIEQEKEKISIEEEEEEDLEAGETSGDVTEQDETSDNGDEEDKEQSTCQSESNNEEEDKAEETSNCTDDEGETGEDEKGRHEETGTGEEEEEEEEEESDTTVKEATTGEEEKESEDDTSVTKEEVTLVEELMEGNISASAEEEDDGTGEEEPQEEEKQGESEKQEGEASEERASPQSQDAITAVCVTEGEEADAEDSDDSKRHSDTSAEESAPEEAGGTGEEEVKGSREDGEEDAVEEFKPEQESKEQEAAESKNEDGTLVHQFTRTSVESQPGSMEEVEMDLPSNS